MKTIQLREIAHGRSGDKANKSNIGLIAKKPEFYPTLKSQVTVDAVRKHFKGSC